MKNKRAQLFTAMAILLIFLLFLSVELFSYIKERKTDSIRVSTMDNFLYSLEENLERQMETAGFRILLLAEQQIITSGNYINVEDFFDEAFFNGTVNGVENPIMNGATYGDLLNSINQKANKINVNITMENISVVASHDDPWHVKFTLISDFVMEDLEGLVRWEKQQNISSFIELNTFGDPIYNLESNNKYSKNIIPTIYDGIYNESGNFANLESHISGHYYTANPLAPSYLKRLEHDLSADPNGIESFIGWDYLVMKGDSSCSGTCIDYIYFSSGASGSVVAGMPSWFAIDDAHKPKYNITS